MRPGHHLDLGPRARRSACRGARRSNPAALGGRFAVRRPRECRKAGGRRTGRMLSAVVIGQPSAVISSRDRMRFDGPSLSTSTPSQSKITSRSRDHAVMRPSQASEAAPLRHLPGHAGSPKCPFAGQVRPPAGADCTTPGRGPGAREPGSASAADERRVAVLRRRPEITGNPGLSASSRYSTSAPPGLGMLGHEGDRHHQHRRFIRRRSLDRVLGARVEPFLRRRARLVADAPIQSGSFQPLRTTAATVRSIWN